MRDTQSTQRDLCRVIIVCYVCFQRHRAYEGTSLLTTRDKSKYLFIFYIFLTNVTVMFTIVPTNRIYLLLPLQANPHFLSIRIIPIQHDKYAKTVLHYILHDLFSPRYLVLPPCAAMIACTRLGSDLYNSLVFRAIYSLRI